MDVFDLFAKISLDTSGYESGLSDASAKTSSFGDKLKSGLSAAAKVGAAALGAATTAAAGFAAASVKTGATFDSSMSQVAATMGTTVDAIQNLRDFALDMGSSTSFSASQAASALNFMALAGYDAEQSMQALPNVLNLAAAGGIELAQASDMVTDAQSALGLTMEQSAELVDMMAMASSKSNTSVAQLGEAILTVGGTAKTLAGGTNELSTALGILADNGVKGAEGGTALRNIILSLSAPTDKAAKLMKSMGVEVFDAAGNMRPLNETFEDLNSALSTMTHGEQTQVLSSLFNKVDLKSVNALLANSGERFNELSGYIADAAGAAEKMANTQLDNLSGDITMFKSALEGAQIVISDGLTPNLREFVQFGTDGISKLSAAFKGGGLSGAMEAFGIVLSDGLSMILSYLPQMVDAGMRLLAAFGEGIISNLPKLAEAAIQIISVLSSGISSSLPELIPVAVSAILEFVEALIDNVDLLVDAAIQITVALAEGLINALPVLIEKAPVIVAKLVEAIIMNAPKLLTAAVEMIFALSSGILQSLPSLASAAIEIVSTIGNTLKQLPSMAVQWGKDLMQSFVSGIRSNMSAVTSAVSGVASKVKSLIGFSEPEEGPLSNFHTYAPDMMKLFAQGIADNAGIVQQQLDRALDLDFGTASIGYAVNGTGTVGNAGNSFGGIVGGNTPAGEPITIIVQSVLDGKVIGETAYQYNRDREKAYGG